MIVAALGDAHGNEAALEAVLKVLDDEGIQTIVHAGDAVVGFPGNRRVIELLQERGVPNVQGQADKQVVRFERKKATLAKKLSAEAFEKVEAAFQGCASEQLEYLRGLPRLWESELDGHSMAVCSGSVTSPNDVLRDDDDIARFERQRESVPAQIIIFGGSHEQFEKRLGDTLMVSPGSVGMARDGKAEFAVIDTESEPWQVDFRSVSY